jgi:hypothetical protein
MDKDTPVDQVPDAAVIEQQEQDDFDAGAAMETTAAPQDGRPRDDNGRFVASTEQPPAAAPAAKKDDKAPAAPAGKAPAAAAAPAPKYVQITEEQFAKFEAALGKTEEFEKQFSKAFGTMGDMQKIMRGLQAQTPKGTTVKLPPGVFDEMKKDFPELGDKFESAMTAIMKGMEGTGGPSAEINTEAFEKQLEARVLKLAAEELADEFPDWQKIVGAVDTTKGETPDAANPFRKWLATKPQEYQDRINGTNSSGVITRAIRTFKSETKAAPPAPAPKPNGQAAARATRIQEAVRPKGDGGHPPGTSADDEFESGFKTG